MQLKAINQITGKIVLVTGLHIGAGNEEVHIGGIDNSVIKHPHTQQPYIPGSSLKGKMRSLLEWRSGAVTEKPLSFESINSSMNEVKQTQIRTIVQLFGASADSKVEEITRLSFWDCSLNKEEWDKIAPENSLYTEGKWENSINRITGTADNPRQTERVPAGAVFDFKLGMKILNDGEEDFVETVLAGLKLLELDGIGGSGSRGYGKIKFENLQLNGEDLQARLEAIDPFKVA
jgi:CRISPR-associated protein Csm3